MNERTKNTKKFYVVVSVILVLILTLTIAFNAYVGDYYHQGEAAQTAATSSTLVTVEQEGDTLVFTPKIKTDKALVFYPGGKVEYSAYAPLMHAFAEVGVTCFLPKMPFNLAVFGINTANGIVKAHPEYTNWYIGGHSLGGSMAASYAEKHAEDFKGLLLCASYSTADLSGSALTVVSVYGSEDGVMNKENYEKYKPNLPEDFKELVINGGCHAYFGDYGAQKGDGTPTITANEQVTLATAFCQISLFSA